MWIIELMFAVSLCLNIVIGVILLNRGIKNRKYVKVRERVEKHKHQRTSGNMLEHFTDIYCAICRGALNSNGDCHVCGFNSQKYNEESENDD